LKASVVARFQRDTAPQIESEHRRAVTLIDMIAGRIDIYDHLIDI